MLILLRLLLLFSLVLSFTFASDFPTLASIFRFFGTDNGKPKDVENMTLEELGVSKGQCTLHFVDYITHRDRDMCAKDDKSILHLLILRSSETIRKPPLLVKCLQPADNATKYQNTLLMMSSVQDIVALLKPIGNATKRHEPGSCVLILFYTESSLGCAQVAPYANVLPILFPTLTIAAIDAFKFPSFNTEFGIVGLPTLLLFHQGRPIVKFYSDVGTFAAFVTRHTGIKPIPAVPKIRGPLPLQPVQKTDYILGLSWIFIFACIAHYFAKTSLCMQIVEMIQRNWRESEAQLEQNSL